jgi:argininosuccinate lyase
VRRSLAGDGQLGDLVADDPSLGPDAAALVAPGVAVRRRTTPGGAGPEPVRVQLERFIAVLDQERARVASR